MDVLYLLVPLSVILVFAVGAVFWWALNNRQFDDLDEASERLLADDDAPGIKENDRAGENTSQAANRPPS
ncbi:cbb3-type cytochrome oxidase assembly protein CcoS [Janthinobacterium sp. 17J80-10]|uniref:cbb3-type cytochrome oxidase assembly protein CcoS n=1 Tax=Janthinobacterium sp. 17J80-10 TaxID=2497863 RepID=UPI001005402E|nr:cbb3-type cytochrome oxidase assembly protein CcoS [Janthinobacterium sp. 17J80-10]QAU34091.1 cbb3-type cytochrome oxidase assembly protein CcoS [Janthinobacterium sp. 17J80-10]